MSTCFRGMGTDDAFKDEEGVLCELCNDDEGGKSMAKYSCSRCGQRYCSVKCFKSPVHQLCSEAFYKKEVDMSVQLSVSSSRSSNEDKLRLIRILDKYQDQSSDAGASWKYQPPALDLDNIVVQQEMESGKDEECRPLTSEEEVELNELLENATPEQLLKLMTPDERQRFEQVLNSGQYEVSDY